jgi:hypothetical protein
MRIASAQEMVEQQRKIEKLKFNPNNPTKETWREDLRHKLLKV